MSKKEILFTVWGKVELIRSGDIIQVVLNNDPMFSIPMTCITRLSNEEGGEIDDRRRKIKSQSWR